MALKVNTVTLASVIKEHYETKVPLMIYGAPGIGKSDICCQVATKIAESQNKKYINWAETTNIEKLEMIKDPSKYFVFCDQRISQMDSTDLRGIPNMMNKDMLETIPMSWIIYFTQPEADGFIFFDEINLAAPVVAGSAYQIIHDRSISDRKLSKHVFLIAAGNRQTDKAYTFDMPFPLRDRFDEYEVTPSIVEWSEWAYGKVNNHIIAFLNWKELWLFRVNDKGTDKSSTPRGWVRSSRMIGNREIISTDVEMLMGGSVGEAAAREFQAYVKYFKELDWNMIFKDPKSIAEFSSDKMYAVAGGLADLYARTTKKESQDLFEKSVSVIWQMKTDFAIITFRMMQRTNETLFKDNVKNHKEFVKIAHKFGKFLLD